MMKNAKRIFSMVLVAAFALSIFAGCAKKPEEFTKEGFEITLTNEFAEQDVPNQYAAYTTDKYIVTMYKDSFDRLEAAEISKDITEEEYAKLVIKNNKVSSEPETVDGIVTFTYDADADGNTMTFLATVKRGNDAYWLIQFACFKDEFEESRGQFLEWAKTIVVD